MALSPDEIERRDFSSSLRGFDKTEVRDFLRRVARDVGRMQTELTRGQTPSSKLREAQEAAAAADSTQIAPPQPPVDATENAFAEAAQLADAIDLTPHQTLDSDDDRFEALGERIAGLLRTAHTSAAQLKENADSEAAGTIKGAHAEAEQIRRHAEEEISVLRAEADRAGESTRAQAAADADRVRAEAEAEVQASHEEAARIRAEAEQILADARAEAERFRGEALEAGELELAERQAQIVENESAAQADREAAMAELVSAREQVSGLLGEARSQSDFIRHEAEEIIRAKIRANVDQAEQRLTMLRNSEVASRERIARAHQELTGALARLDSETAPALPENAEHAVLEEAYERGEASGFGSTPLPPLPTTAPPMPPIPPADASFTADPNGSDSNGIIEIAEVFGTDGTEVAPIPEPPAAEATGPEATGPESVSPESADEALKGEAVTFDDDAAITSDLPVRPTAPAVADAPFSPDELVAEPLDVDEADLPPVAVPENEDALARLVREAMQRAVDSARSSEE